MKTKRFQQAAAALLLAALASNAFAAAAASHDETNEANNPLTPKITLNLHDYYAPETYGADGASNQLLFRGVVPHKIGGTPQLFRFTLPIVTTPDYGTGHHTNIGDLNIMDLFPFKLEKVEVGIGPQLTLPTAFHSDDGTGTGKWQAGLAALAIAPQPWGILGGLVTWQADFAGDGDRAHQNNLTLQPFVIYNLPNGFYLRSTAIMNFKLNHERAYGIPVGFGAGKVVKLKSGTTLNIFLEPQWTVIHHGEGMPKYQFFLGINFQFPIHINAPKH